MLWKHLLKCPGDKTACDMQGLQFDAILATTNIEFNNTILASFHKDDVGKLRKTDPMITVVGKILWERSVRKTEEPQWGNEKAGNIALCCERYKQEQRPHWYRYASSKKNFWTVVEALNGVTAKEDDGVRAGLKLSLGYLLKKAARLAKCQLIIEGKDEKVKERDKFLSLVDGSWWYLFNTA